MTDHDALTSPRPRAILFDLLTALLDSWTLWNHVAGDPDTGMRWRRHYLTITYATGPYRPYEDLVAEATRAAGLDPRLAGELVRRWDELEPWPEAPEILRELARSYRLALVTNCSEELARRAVRRLQVPVDALVSAERAGYYKPHPQPYRLALETLGLDGADALFVAGSAADVPGAATVGLRVIWHNRAAIPAVDSTSPLATISTLDPLVEIARRHLPSSGHRRRA